MDLSQISVLKQMITVETDFRKIWEFFLDHFGEDVEFIGSGRRLTDQKHPLFTAIKAIGRQILARNNIASDPLRITNQLLIQLPDYKFIHGGMIVQGRMANVFYFDDIKVGIMYMMMEQSEFARFSLAKAPTTDGYRN